MATRRHLLPCALAALALSACAHARNYADPQAPRFAGSYRTADADPPLRIASFNVKFSLHPDGAIALFREHPELGGADVVALQEMNEHASERIARALGYDYVYYPSAFHPSAHGKFGTAVLSRWPIVEDHKLVLPHPSRWRKLQRAVTVAVVQMPARRLRVYSVHLETPFGISHGQREEQARTILDDAATSTDAVIVAGDFNSRWIAADFERAGFRWLTKDVGGTIHAYQWDHVFVRGLPVPAKPRAGRVHDTHGVSDHRPVWVEIPLDEAAPVSAPAANP
jgi:endonuclease/exonuclease/phosphatase family metal-dependent hydrolase